MVAGPGLTNMGRLNAVCPPGQQACVLDAAICLLVAASTSGALRPQREISINAAAMNLVLIPSVSACLSLTRHEITPL